MDQDRKCTHNLTPSPTDTESSGRFSEESTLPMACFGMSAALGSLPLQSMDPPESQGSVMPFQDSFTVRDINQFINISGASGGYDNARGWSANDQGIFSNGINQEVNNLIRLTSTLFPGYQVILEPYTEPLTYSNHTMLQAALLQPAACSTGDGSLPQEMPVIEEFAMKEDDSEYHDQDSSEFRGPDEPQDVIMKLDTELQPTLTADVNWYVNSVEQVSMERIESHTLPTDAEGTDMDELIRTRFLLKLHQQAAKITRLIIKDNDPFN